MNESLDEKFQRVSNMMRNKMLESKEESKVRSKGKLSDGSYSRIVSCRSRV